MAGRALAYGSPWLIAAGSVSAALLVERHRMWAFVPPAVFPATVALAAFGFAAGVMSQPGRAGHRVAGGATAFAAASAAIYVLVAAFAGTAAGLIE